MFEFLEIKDIINVHKGVPAVIEGHGPSASVNRDKINKLHEKKEIIVFGINEWWSFQNHPIPDYWVRCHTGANGGWLIEREEDLHWFDRGTAGGKIPLFNCDTADRSSLQSAMERLNCPYLPYDNRHLGGRTCNENHELLEWFTPLNKTFFPDCCSRRGRLTIQEEFQKYTKYSELISASSFTATVYMINFAVIMGCNPVYINGMELDYFGEDGIYAELTKGNDWRKTFPDFSPGPDSWKGWRRDWMMRDFNIINESTKNIGVETLNLNHNTWYGIFENGSLK